MGNQPYRGKMDHERHIFFTVAKCPEDKQLHIICVLTETRHRAREKISDHIKDPPKSVGRHVLIHETPRGITLLQEMTELRKRGWIRIGYDPIPQCLKRNPLAHCGYVIKKLFRSKSSRSKSPFQRWYD